ncbi:MAG: hypothetical protein KDB73_09545, partial [Planctomycetes bacterium]|nr:hypothetical protein [Planctomycetota bacterium]
RRVLQLLAELPEPYRTALWSRHFRDMPPRDIAKENRVPVETVRTWLKRGHQRLREQLDATDAQGGRAWRAALLPCLGAAGGRPVGWGGGLAMASATKSGVLGALVLLALGVGAWFVLQLGGDGRERAPGEVTGQPRDLAHGANESVGAPVLSARGQTGGVQEGSAALAGRVVDSRGQPVASARIKLGAADAIDVDPLEEVASTSEDGQFRVVGTLPEGRHAIAAVGPDGRLVVEHVTLPARDPLVLRLPAQLPDEIRVVSATNGEPLAGAACELRLREVGRTWLHTVRTDAEGRASIPAMRSRNPRPWRLLRVQLEGFAMHEELDEPRRTPTERGSAAAPRTIRLRPGGSVTVRVRDESGRPVSGALVTGWSGLRDDLDREMPEFNMDPGVPQPQDSLLDMGRAVTDKEGLATLARPTEFGIWTIRAESTSSVGFKASRYGPPAPGLDVVVTLREGCRVRGRVVDVDGAPVAGAIVRVEPAEVAEQMAGGRVDTSFHPLTLLRHRARTSTDGRFELGPVAPPRDGSPMVIGAHAWALGAAWSRVDAKDAVGDVDVEIVFDAPRTQHRFVVEDATGVGVEGATVFWSNMRPGVQTDARGVAVMEVPSLPLQYLQVVAPGHATFWLLPDPSGTTHIVLHPPTVLRGRLVDAEGTGVPGSVSVHLIDAKLEEVLKESTSLLMLGSACADEEGRFLIEGLPPPPWKVSYSFLEPQLQGGKEYVHGEARVTSNAEVVLAFTRPVRTTLEGSTVQGTVFDPEGALLEVYTISLEGLRRSLQPRVTETTFVFDPVPPGTYQLVASNPERTAGAFLDVRVQEGDPQLTIPVRLQPFQQRRIRLVDPHGAAVPGATVQWRRSGTRAVRGGGSSNDSGVLSMADVLPGAYSLELMAPQGDEAVAYLPSDPVLELRQDAVGPQDVAVVPAGRLVFNLDDKRFWPVARRREEPTPYDDRAAYDRSRYVIVRVTRENDGVERTSGGLYAGRNVFPWSLEPGTHRVFVKQPRGLAFETTVVVRAGEDTEVIVRFD